MLTAVSEVWRNATLRGASLGVFANGVSFAAVMPYQSVVGISELVISPTLYALVAFIASLFAVAISVSIGIATDRSVDRRTIMTAALIVGMVGNGVVALVPVKGVFISAHVFLIPVAVGIYGQFFAMIRLETSDKELHVAASISSVIRAIFSLAWMVAPLLSSVLIQMGYPLVVVYAIAAIASLAGLIALWSIPKPAGWQQANANIHVKGIVSDIRRLDVVVRLMLVGVVISCPRLASMLLGLVVLSNGLGNQVDVGVLAGVMAFLEIPYILGSGIALRFLSLPIVICLGAVLYAIFLIGISVAPSLAVLYGIAILGALGAAIIGSLTIGYLQDLTPGRPGAGGSLISVGSFIGALIASVVFALGANTVGYAGTALIGAVLAVSGGILLVLQHK